MKAVRCAVVDPGSSRRLAMLALVGAAVVATMTALPIGPAHAAGRAAPSKENPPMHTARQALEAALKASATRLDQRPIINIVVDPGDQRYTVHLALQAPVAQPMTDCLSVTVDADSGVAAAPAASSCPNPLRDLLPEWQHSAVLDGRHAYQAALQAIHGYEHYDAHGRLEIRLKDDHYEVTFPDPAARLQGGHTADFTYQVWLNARTGAVLKILAAS